MKRKETHYRDKNAMILIFFKLIIHLTRIGLLYSFDEKQPNHLLESIGRADLSVVT